LTIFNERAYLALSQSYIRLSIYFSFDCGPRLYYVPATNQY